MFRYNSQEDQQRPFVQKARIAIEKTSAAGINTGAHFIFGLPGESRAEMLRMAEIISAKPLSTVKYHQLQIMKGTAIEKEYRDNPNDFLRFSLEEYIDFIVEFVERLNPSLVIERFTGEAPPRFLSEITCGKTRT
jgi:radical SAM superfamily enzyme